MCQEIKLPGRYTAASIVQEDDIMKKYVIFAMTVFLASMFSLVVASEQVQPAKELVVAAADQATPAGEELILSGTIDEKSQLVNDQGETFILVNNDKGMEVMSMSGQKVEIRGTVMEKEGQKTVEVIEYNIIK
jgi:uncharacterized membrane-anchored protein